MLVALQAARNKVGSLRRDYFLKHASVHSDAPLPYE